MNERIRDMAYKTCFEAGFNGPEHFIFYNSDMKEFSELLMEDLYDFIMDEVGNDNGIPSLERIKEHFGVK